MEQIESITALSTARSYDLVLPDDLVDYLANPMDIDTKFGIFTCNPDATTGDVLFIRNEKEQFVFSTSVGGPAAGVYCTIGIVPLKAPPHADSIRIPVWVPKLTRYGGWHEDSSQLFLFPESVTWTMIREELPRFIYPPESSIEVFSDIRLHRELLSALDYVPDRLDIVIDFVMSEPIRVKRKMLVSLIERGETLLERYPFSPELIGLYSGLSVLYQGMADVIGSSVKSLPQDDIVREMIQWYEKAVVLLELHLQHRLSLSNGMTAPLYLLGLWYAEIGQYTRAMEYVERYRALVPNSEGAYDEVCYRIKEKDPAWRYEAGHSV